MVNRYVIGTTACPGLRSGINSGAGRRHQPPSPKQPQPTVAREKCSAGACPQLRAACVAQTTTDPSINQCTQFSHLGVPAPAGMGNWYENEWFPLPKSSFRPLNSSFPRRRESRGEGWHQPPPNTSNDQVSFSHLGVPAPTGMGDWYENAPTRFSSAPTNPSIRHSREGGNPEGWGEGVVTLGLVPSLGRAARSRTLHRPAYHHFHPLMRPSQGHGDSGERWNPEGEGKGKTMAILAIDAVWALRLRQLAELARPHTKTTQRRAQT